MRLRKWLVVLGLVGAVAALVVAGTAFAQTPTPTPNQQSKTNYREFFLDRLANALGTSRDKLIGALTQARNETVDQAVKDGKLTQQQADRIKSKQGVAPFGFRGPGPGWKGHGGAFFMGGTEVRDAIAKALGITPEELSNQLRSGKTLAELAQGKEQAVKDAIANAARPRLDEAVKNGRLTQDQANQIISRIQSSDLTKIGAHWSGGRGWHRGDGGQNQAPGNKPSMGRPAPRTGAL